MASTFTEPTLNLILIQIQKRLLITKILGITSITDSTIQ
jgi:hypothetical protein